MDNNAFGKHARKVRLSAGLTLTSAAKQLGIDKGRMSRIETGQTPIPGADLVNDMEVLYEVPPGALSADVLDFRAFSISVFSRMTVGLEDGAIADALLGTLEAINMAPDARAWWRGHICEARDAAAPDS